MKLTVKDMKNPNMTNDEAIAMIEANYPSERYSVLRDAMILAVRALKMTRRKSNDPKGSGENSGST